MYINMVIFSSGTMKFHKYDHTNINAPYFTLFPQLPILFIFCFCFKIYIFLLYYPFQLTPCTHTVNQGIYFQSRQTLHCTMHYSSFHHFSVRFCNIESTHTLNKTDNLSVLRCRLKGYFFQKDVYDLGIFTMIK